MVSWLSTASQGSNTFGSVRPFMCLCGFAGPWHIVPHHYGMIQSQVSVCLSVIRWHLQSALRQQSFVLIWKYFIYFRGVFVADHLLFYTVLLQEVLPRFFRMDLSAAKNAYMLFRLSKVFNLPNLKELIRDGENYWIITGFRGKRPFKEKMN